MRKSDQGFSLIEIVISLAIIGIVTITLLQMFTSGLQGIYRANDKTEEVFLSQSEIESKFEQGATTSDTISITFPVQGSLVEKTISVSGELVTGPITNKYVEITAFIPYKK